MSAPLTWSLRSAHALLPTAARLSFRPSKLHLVVESTSVERCLFRPLYAHRGDLFPILVRGTVCSTLARIPAGPDLIDIACKGNHQPDRACAWHYFPCKRSLIGMRILVTGGLGHIGSSLIRRLLDNAETEHLTILDDFSTQRYASLLGLTRTGRLTVVEGSILRPEDLDRAIRGVQSVVHLAAITNAEGSFADPEQVKLVNTEGTRRVIQACQAHGV